MSFDPVTATKVLVIVSLTAAALVIAAVITAILINRPT